MNSRRRIHPSRNLAVGYHYGSSAERAFEPATGRSQSVAAFFNEPWSVTLACSLDPSLALDHGFIGRNVMCRNWQGFCQSVMSLHWSIFAIVIASALGEHTSPMSGTHKQNAPAATAKSAVG
jgi:hypothetical protein